ncbi:cytochrome P450 [Crucibulum laeve]|uniref:Cytochrome P450 n=1 Tax=Crucibulum laeve TaxID=68775 RepID=A0A5C3M7Y0_9AGAR|nr:cytochrome P450 [Crucibulum laeve]
MTLQTIISGALGFYAAYIVFDCLRNIFFHPLRSFPGPKLAAMSILYKAYFDVMEQGGFLNEIKRLHTIYGPVVRTAPNELHFSDSHAYHEIYAPGSTFTKEPVTYKCFNSDGSSFTFIDPHQSKIRREMLNPLFSRRAILKLEGVIQQKVDKLINRITSYPDKLINISLAFRCATVDIIASYCFAECIEALDAEEFNDPFITGTFAFTRIMWIIKYFPFLARLFLSMPDWLAKRCDPFYDGIRALHIQVAKQVDHYLENEDALETAEHEIVYHHLIKPKGYKGRHATPSRRDLNGEALSLLQAGSETVGATCTVGAFYAFKIQRIRDKLVSELRNAWPDINSPMPYTTLEKLPYLTAVIKESLRFTTGIVTPLPRVVGPGDAEIYGYRIPAGTVVASGATLVHENPDIFQDPDQFYPERWLQSDTSLLDKNLVPFSRGPRMCLGFNLAWAELYLLFGNIFRKLDFDLKDTTLQEMSEFQELFVGIHEMFYARVGKVNS